MTEPRWIVALATLLGAAGLWLLLPRGRAGGRMAGAVLAAASLGLLASQLSGLGNWLADGIFWVLFGVTVVGGVGAVTFRNPVYCALWFALALLGVSGIFLVIGAQFLAVATLVVYAGAILVTFLFVLMLAQPEGRAPYDRVSSEAMISAAVGAILVGLLTATFTAALQAPAAEGRRPITADSEAAMAQNVLAPEQVARLGGELFSKRLLAVEIAGVLLLAALIGASAVVAHARVADGTPEEPRAGKA